MSTTRNPALRFLWCPGIWVPTSTTRNAALRVPRCSYTRREIPRKRYPGIHDHDEKILSYSFPGTQVPVSTTKSPARQLLRMRIPTLRVSRFPGTYINDDTFCPAGTQVHSRYPCSRREVLPCCYTGIQVPMPTMRNPALRISRYP